jgi:Protein of unknown function (DUF2795)
VDFLRKHLPSQVGRYLNGLKFPARKEELLGRLERNGVPGPVVGQLRKRLPEVEYHRTRPKTQNGLSCGLALYWGVVVQRYAWSGQLLADSPAGHGPHEPEVKLLVYPALRRRLFIRSWTSALRCSEK